MTPRSLRAVYVLTDAGRVMAQVPDDSPFGFALTDGEQTWPGGFGAAESWEALADDDPRIADRDRDAVGWCVDDPDEAMAAARWLAAHAREVDAEIRAAEDEAEDASRPS